MNYDPVGTGLAFLRASAAAFLIITAFSKAAGIKEVWRSAADLGVPDNFARQISGGAILAESIIGFWLVCGLFPVGADAALCLLLIGTFLVSVWAYIVRPNGQCSCFGAIHRQNNTLGHVIFNLSLLSAAVVVSVYQMTQGYSFGSFGIANIVLLSLFVAIGWGAFEAGRLLSDIGVRSDSK